MHPLLARAKSLAKKNGLLKIHYMALRSAHPLANTLRIRENFMLAPVCTRTLVSYERLQNTRALCEASVEHSIPGAFVECGVWRGGVAALMAGVARHEGKQRKTHLFDSFEGLPSPTEEDGSMGEGYEHRELDGELKPVDLYVAGFEQVKQFLFGELGLSNEAVLLHKGWFQNVLPGTAPEIGDIAVLRIDADWYDSVRICLLELYDRVVSGGYVILDDYGGYPGCKRAWDEFAEEREINVKLNIVDEYGVWFRKP